MKNYSKKISFLTVFALSIWGILTAFQVRPLAQVPTEADDEENFERFLSEVPTEADNEKYFERFLAELPKGKLPFVLSANQLQKHLEANTGESNKRKTSPLEMVRLSYSYNRFLPNMEGSQFSRVPPSASGLMTVPVEENHLVVYASGRIYGGYQIFYSVLYDKKGKILKEEKMAEIHHDFLMEGAISEDLQLKTTTYKIVWTDEESRYDRKIKQLEKDKEAVKTLLKLPNTHKQSQSKELKKAMP